jgi:hypothetical protein
VSLLDVDDELKQYVSPVERVAARQATVARTVVVQRAEHLAMRRPGPAHLGYMIVEGFLIRRVSVAGGCSVELLGPGDMVRPWLEETVSFSRGALEPLAAARLAVLDHRFSAAIHQWTHLHGVLVERGVQRARSLAVLNAIGQILRLEPRLTAFFWYLAERWGSRRYATTELSLPLTHQLIADLVGASRPSVSSALGRLARNGTLVREGSLWLLRGEPPAPGGDG